ncbi:MAG TPA: HepT-like ribonuclease domain-containing protein [Methanospirillum sp.]|nr:HepT-like ribonuclease domain-containing protein [Methanospirillum sp.]
MLTKCVDAVVRNFEIIGEAGKNRSDDLKATFPATNWNAVAGFRDTLIHGYFGVDMDILRDIIMHKIPLL